MESKKCTYCKETKTLDQFYKIKFSAKDGYDYYCKYCRNGNSLRSQRNTEKAKKCTIKECEKQHYARGYCRKHYARLIRNGTTQALTIPMKTDEDRVYTSTVDIVSKTGKRYTYAKSQIVNQEIYLKHKFNITLEQYNEMAKDGCQICHTMTDTKLHVDHDHNCCAYGSCGKCVRGVVCNRCNSNIGHFERGTIRQDNPHLKTIEKYLARYAKKRAKIDNS